MDIRNVIILGLTFILFFFVFKNCGENNSTGPGDSNIEYYTDTVVKTEIDTVFFPVIQTVTETELVYTEIEIDSLDSSKYYSFKSKVEDSLIDGTILTQIYNKEDSLQLIYQDITYTPKFPKYINRTDSIFIHDSTVVTKYDTRPKFMIGLNMTTGTSEVPGGLTPNIGMEFQDRYIINTGYDVLNKQIMFGIKYKFKFKKRK